MTTTTTTITSVKKEPIKDQIYHIIKSKILNHQYEPGKRLSIMSISRELNVSNSPVREAISMLERDGLVETYPNAGPSVITISEERLAQVAEAILSMLLGALEICEQKDKIDRLVGLLQNALKVQTANLQMEDEHQYAKYSIAFEAAFVECCENPYLTKQYKEIEDLFYLIVMYDQFYIHTVRTQAVLEHQQILGCIMDGRLEKAKDLLSKHYNRFKKIA
ncbi:MAG: GntR family transcriptional regulator [Firmicutes bacterium]|nr:GntR family transcriptional regulator [Bacillota bacterium]